MNGKHRARWLAEIVAETQRFVKQAQKRECPESALVQQGLNKLIEARELALESGEAEPGDDKPAG